MIKWLLILCIVESSGGVTTTKPYESRELCEAAAATWLTAGAIEATCVQVPEPSTAHNTVPLPG